MSTLDAASRHTLDGWYDRHIHGRYAQVLYSDGAVVADVIRVPGVDIVVWRVSVDGEHVDDVHDPAVARMMAERVVRERQRQIEYGHEYDQYWLLWWLAAGLAALAFVAWVLRLI